MFQLHTAYYKIIQSTRALIGHKTILHVCKHDFHTEPSRRVLPVCKHDFHTEPSRRVLPAIYLAVTQFL